MVFGIRKVLLVMLHVIVILILLETKLKEKAQVVAVGFIENP